MKTTNTISGQEKFPEKETQPVLPPEHPVTKPDTKPEKESNEPFHPQKEIQPVHQPDIKPERV